MTRVLVTGGAGFIGSNLVDRLLADGHHVVAFDNLSTGHEAFLSDSCTNTRCSFVRGDILDATALRIAMVGVDVVFHLAANADVRFGTDHPRKDLEQNTIGTYEVIEAARVSGVRTMFFSSTGSVYGEPIVHPTPEDAPFPVQTSLYGASKLAGEALLSAYCEAFGMRGVVCRFVSVLGDRYTHGHVFDFVRALRTDPAHLHVLGNGKQRKSYLHVRDLVDALITIWEQRDAPQFQTYNLGTDHYCQVDQSVGWICDELGVNPAIEHAGGERGWIGDSPFIFLDCSRLRSLGWHPRYSIEQGVRATVQYLVGQPHLLEQH